MNKLYVVSIIALCINNALGQDFWFGPNGELQFLGQAQNPGLGQFSRQDQFNGFLFPGQGQLPGQRRFPGQAQFPEQGQFPGQGRFPGQGQLPTQPTESPAGSTTQSTAVSDCIRNCAVTTEYNPVCGTNNVTYTNPGRLYCAQGCGVSVSLLRRSKCPPTA